MSKFATRLLMLAMYATTLVAVPLVIPAEAATNSTKHIKHKKTIHNSWSAGQAWPVTRPYSPPGEVCPGLARSFECRTWPPPFDQDPDRRVPGRL
jgi:hypothetical protein